MQSFPADFPADVPPEAILVADEQVAWNAAALDRRVAALAQALRAGLRAGAALAILADNGPDWIVADLATRAASMSLVPLPSFFTPAQWRHAVDSAAVEGLFCLRAEHAALLGFGRAVDCPGGLRLFARPAPAATVPPGVQKITFTSGTTAQPKGVCLSAGQQWELARVLSEALAGLGIRRHLSLLPLSVLLENIAGTYTALLSGATNVCLPLARTGLSGAARFDPVACLDSIAAERAESVILLPQMLQALVLAARPGDERLRTLKFIAVGGAKTPAALIAAARARGFPVYEGYGLSECGSVVSLNLPGQDRPGSAGRPLPNRRVRIAADGEIEVGGGSMAGYLGMPAPAAGWMGTGDLGHLDADGYLHIDGRKKNVLVTAYGRNVSPEWPEALLLGSGALAQALVVGDARPYLAAALVPLRADQPDASLEAAVAQANRELPDYARIRRWFRTRPFGEADGTATANGRLRRDAAFARCRAEIEALYGAGDPNDDPSEALTNPMETDMQFYDILCQRTDADRQQLFSTPVIQDALRGDIVTAQYIAFLSQAYHHVRHTVPLMMACGSRLGEDYGWLRRAVADYIEEEIGHEEWILSDIAACGGDAEAVRRSRPQPATETMVAYAYHQVDRGNPVGFFGMVHVLEGTSTALATEAADTLRGALGLPQNAFSYLSSHGSLDLAHVAFFRDLVNGLEHEADREAVVHCAGMIYRLYGEVFRALPRRAELAQGAA